MNAPESHGDSTPSDRTQPCSNCHQQFHCEIAQGKDHCWCMNLPAILPVRAQAGCLCVECLQHAIAELQQADAAQTTNVVQPAPCHE